MFSEICQSTPGFSLNFVNLPQDVLWTSSIYPKSFSEFVNLPEDFLWKSSIYPQSFSKFRQSTPRFSLNFVNLPQGFLWTSSIDPKVFFLNFVKLHQDFLISPIYPEIFLELRQYTQGFYLKFVNWPRMLFCLLCFLFFFVVVYICFHLILCFLFFYISCSVLLVPHPFSF